MAGIPGQIVMETGTIEGLRMKAKKGAQHRTTAILSNGAKMTVLSTNLENNPSVRVLYADGKNVIDMVYPHTENYLKNSRIEVGSRNILPITADLIQKTRKYLKWAKKL